MKCQKSNLMWPVKPPIHMWSVTTSRNKKLVGSASDKNCQATICYKKQRKSEYDDFKSQSSMCSGKHCQENQNMQSIHMWSVRKLSLEVKISPVQNKQIRDTKNQA